jgi:hypothetical protein
MLENKQRDLFFLLKMGRGIVEDAIHFILECCLYNEAREELKLRLVFFHELKIEVLLFGDDTLTEMQNLRDLFFLLKMGRGIVIING